MNQIDKRTPTELDHRRSGPGRFRRGISPAARAGEETDALR